MEDQALRRTCNQVIHRIGKELEENPKVIAAYLLGSMSHDKIWKWSDIQFEVIVDDGYKEKRNYCLYEDGFVVTITIRTNTEFKNFLQHVDYENYLWKAFSKATKLFSRDFLLDELLEEVYYIGDVDQHKELLLGFTGVVYYLNKAEKNLYVKENLENATYFVPLMVENIAYMEVMKEKRIPEREIIPQARKLNPELFQKIYDPLYEQAVQKETIKSILNECVTYLEENTALVYRPILDYLNEHGTLEEFHYPIRPNGFGINYDWLVRVGIAEYYGLPVKVPFLQEEHYLVGFRIRKKL